MTYKFPRDFEIQTDYPIPTRRPDFVLTEKEFVISEILTFKQTTEKKKENGKRDKYLDLVREVKNNRT